ncbi:SIS domain-containing protein [Octadecabacter sp. 1_MG-2023]|uniref:SIS domain-containing protein n=1 Tax=unclassified Octadecabacter TaxID=196158 RepID=UPI001C08BFF4|nr:MULTISPECIES: SIS domain-containing protein [unclassified Octadecabacter]MBU2994067.1 SIS domain-containing protein [Octadecabacter sp. B2R22]MDO6736079.1 SIS domain-containing protein [Octadecabacter sp. 1_MG-2023]
MTSNDFQKFTTSYYKKFADTLLSFDKGPLADVLAVFDAVVARGGTVWMAGNGGSAAIADHSVCDCSKGTHVPGTQPFRTMSLASNVSILSALANDVSYDDVFSEQLKYYLTDKDALLVVSSSGNSTNVVKACEYAKAQGVPTIAFVGFSGGKLADIADTVIHIEIDNYGIVEDTHQSLIHMLTQYMRARNEAAVSS